MGFTAFSKAQVIGFGPGAIVTAEVGPQVNAVAQDFVTMPAHLHPMYRLGLITDGRGARVTLEHLRRLKAVAIVAQFGQ